MFQGKTDSFLQERKESVHPEVEVLAIGACSGSVGELWQGPAWSGSADEVALVTLHGPNQSIAYASNAPDATGDLERVVEDHLRLQAEQLFYELTAAPSKGIGLRYMSDIPRGKGMASSTADIVAVIRCLAKLHGMPPSDELIREILRRIERSDPIFHNYHSVYFSGLQREYRRFATRIGFYAYWSFGNQDTDTKRFDRNLLLDAYSQHRQDYQISLTNLIDAMDTGNASAVAAESTVSARLAQSYLPSATVGNLLENYQSLGALGVLRGHTGTVAGLLFSERPRPELAVSIKKIFSLNSMEPYEGNVGLC